MPESSRGTADASLFGNQAIDQAICGICAGCVSVLCMHPLDLLKVKFQVSTHSSQLHHPPRPTILASLGAIVSQDGFRGLYRGLSPNMVGNASSWGFYFLWYSLIKKRMAAAPDGSPTPLPLSAGQHLLASASSGVITAMLTNPLWVVKTRMFTSRPETVGSYRNVWDGLYRISIEEGARGLWKGSVLALIGVSNGAIQFMVYEELKKWRHRARIARRRAEEDREALSNVEYILLSGASKLVAIGLTYPYQVVRSRLQNQLFVRPVSSSSLPPPHRTPAGQPAQTYYRSIPHCIKLTYKTEGLKAFYKGLATNALRVLPGTCVTFVVYENLSSWFKVLAVGRKRVEDG